MIKAAVLGALALLVGVSCGSALPQGPLPLSAVVDFSDGGSNVPQVRPDLFYSGAWDSAHQAYLLRVTGRVYGGTPPYTAAFTDPPGAAHSSVTFDRASGKVAGVAYAFPLAFPSLTVTVKDQAGNSFKREFPDSGVPRQAPPAPLTPTAPKVVITAKKSSGPCHQILTAAVLGGGAHFSFAWVTSSGKALLGTPTRVPFNTERPSAYWSWIPLPIRSGDRSVPQQSHPFAENFCASVGYWSCPFARAFSFDFSRFLEIK